MPPRVAAEPFKEVKDCIKQLGPNKWLLGPPLICERDDDKPSSAFRTRFVEPDGSSSKVQESLEGPPPHPRGPIQFVRCIATMQHGELASGHTSNQNLGLQDREQKLLPFNSYNKMPLQCRCPQSSSIMLSRWRTDHIPYF